MESLLAGIFVVYVQQNADFINTVNQQYALGHRWKTVEGICQLADPTSPGFALINPFDDGNRYVCFKLEK